jgi:pyrroline-5-carboxylate reductase
MLTSVGFIGAGMMATSLMDGLVAKKVIESNSIICSDIMEVARTKATSKGYTATESNTEVAQKAETAIILATKPFIIPDACKDIASVTDRDALIISIAAGVTIETLENLLPGRRVIRVMPNTPCLVGQAAAAFALGSLANNADREVAHTIFGSVGIAMEVKEPNLDAVTGLSGSGPAYVFQFIEALSDGGVRAGLARPVAMKLAAQTVKGAAQMVLETGTHPGALKDAVCSPGGTTIAGVEALEKGGFRAATISAVCAATRRSMQLGGISAEEISHKNNL